MNSRLVLNVYSDMNLSKHNPVNVLVLIAHGSRRRESNNEVLKLEEQLQKHLTPNVYDHVSACFLELASPSLETCIDKIDTLYPKPEININILPYFLSSGNHVEKDIPHQLSLLENRYKHISFNLLDYIGKNGALLNFLIDKAQ